MTSDKQEVLHPTTGQKVTVTKVTQLKNKRRIYFRAYGTSGCWVEYQKKGAE